METLRVILPTISSTTPCRVTVLLFVCLFVSQFCVLLCVISHLNFTTINFLTQFFLKAFLKVKKKFPLLLFNFLE